MKLKLYSVLIILPLLTACESLVTRQGVREAEQKKEFTDKVQTLQRTNADSNNRFADIETDLRQINGRVEVVENRIAQVSQDRDKVKKNTDEQLVEMQKKVNIIQEEVTKLSDAVGVLSAELARSKQTDAAGPAKISTNVFEVAEEAFEKKDWKKAILNYQKFRENRPKDKKITEAIYKIGVCFQELGMKDEAKTFYDELISKYPNTIEGKKAKIRLKKIK